MTNASQTTNPYLESVWRLPKRTSSLNFFFENGKADRSDSKTDGVGGSTWDRTSIHCRLPEKLQRLDVSSLLRELTDEDEAASRS
jgi:hypothetical protein